MRRKGAVAGASLSLLPEGGKGKHFIVLDDLAKHAVYTKVWPHSTFEAAREDKPVQGGEARKKRKKSTK
jgi:hypothetical protein